MVEVGGADGVRVKFDAAEIDDEGEAGGVVDDDLFGGAAGGEGERDGAEEGGEIGWVRAFGRRARAGRSEGGSVDETLEDDGAVANALEGSGSDGEVVADEVELGELDFAGEVELFRVRDADGVVVDGEEFGGVVLGGGLHGHRVYRHEVRCVSACDRKPDFEWAAGDGIEAVIVALEVRGVRGFYAGGG